MLVSLIVAMAKNRVIGRDGQLPWHVPSDLQRFKTLTMGHVLLMGRRTFESIGRPLPGRRTIVISRNSEYNAPGCEVVSSIEAGLQSAGNAAELFICGGADIYCQTMLLAERIYLTEFDAEMIGDCYFPIWKSGDFEQVHSECQQDILDYSFSIWQRVETE